MRRCSPASLSAASAGRPHLLYSLTKSFTSVAVGLAIGDGLLSLDDRVVDVLPDHVPAGIGERGRSVTVHHLLSMTCGHPTDSLAEAWQLETGRPGQRLSAGTVPRTRRNTARLRQRDHVLLARMVDRVTGRGLPELLDERLFAPIGIDHAEWDRVASGAAFGFHGLHLTTEAVAAFGELLRREGRWGGRQLVPRDWVRLATRRHIETRPAEIGAGGADFLCGYGYQFWMSRHGYFGNGANGQQCIVVPEHDLVVAMTCATVDLFVADLYVVTTPHRVRLVVDAEAGTAVATWNTVPLTTPDLTLHLRSPLMTRPDVA
ncbi:serine hydrolase [Actinoplanes sp. NPDC026619]|uniref:serine hydrolase domain-containing protein n=1 Tax=Actinoplanes sp. NPDC026619 TaxID=3155798 RepID=UPI0033C3DD3C